MKAKKVLSIIFTILLIGILLIVPTISFADVYTPTQFNTKISTADANSVKSVGGRVVGIIQVVGTIVAVGMLIVLGIKYMMGSAEERAEYKKTLFPYLIGAVLIFAASNLAQMVYSWASTIK